jgi:hypothetical protein
MRDLIREVIQDDKGDVRCVNTVFMNERLCGPSKGERKEKAKSHSASTWHHPLASASSSPSCACDKSIIPCIRSCARYPGTDVAARAFDDDDDAFSFSFSSTHNAGVSMMRSTTSLNASVTPTAVLADASTNRHPVNCANAAPSSVGTCREYSWAWSAGMQARGRARTMSSLLPTTILTTSGGTYFSSSSSHPGSASNDSRFDTSYTVHVRGPNVSERRVGRRSGVMEWRTDRG